MGDPTPPRREPAPLPEVVFHEPSGAPGGSASSTVSASTAAGAGRSSLSRSIVPGLAAPVDAVVYRCATVLGLTAGAAAIAWYGAGRDGRLDDGEKWTAFVALGLGVVAFLVLLAAVTSAVSAIKVVRGNQPHRFGIARAAICGVATVVCFATTAALVQGDVRDARKVVTAQAAGKQDASPAAVADTAPSGLTTTEVTHLKVGTCLRWPMGPTAQERLHDRPDVSMMKVVPCSAAHGYEVVAQVAFPTDGRPYPSVEFRRATVDPVCKLDLLAYLTAKGASPVRTSRFDTFGISPSAGDWSSKFHTGICVAIPPVASTTVKGSLKGTG